MGRVRCAAKLADRAVPQLRVGDTDSAACPLRLRSMLSVDARNVLGEAKTAWGRSRDIDRRMGRYDIAHAAYSRRASTLLLSQAKVNRAGVANTLRGSWAHHSSARWAIVSLAMKPSYTSRRRELYRRGHHDRLGEANTLLS